MKSTEMLAEQCETVSNLLKAIAHPQRLRILCRLVEGPSSVADLEEYCGASQSLVSQYLGRMKAEGLLKSEREGKYVFYEIQNPELKEMMKGMQKIFCK